MSDSLQPHGPYSIRLLCPWDSPGKNTRVGCHSLLQGIFPTQGPRDQTRVSYISCTCRWVLYHWHHLGRPLRMICLHKLFGILLFKKSISFPHLCMCLNISLIVWTHGYLFVLMFLLLEMFQLCHRELFLSALLSFWHTPRHSGVITTFLNWSIVDLQYCVGFRCTAKWFSFTYFIQIIFHYKLIKILNIIPCVIQQILAAYLFFLSVLDLCYSVRVLFMA